jgi:hypothetical protein
MDRSSFNLELLDTFFLVVSDVLSTNSSTSVPLNLNNSMNLKLLQAAK